MEEGKFLKIKNKKKSKILFSFGSHLSLNASFPGLKCIFVNQGLPVSFPFFRIADCQNLLTRVCSCGDPHLLLVVYL